MLILRIDVRNAPFVADDFNRRAKTLRRHLPVQPGKRLARQRLQIAARRRLGALRRFLVRLEDRFVGTAGGPIRQR